MNFEVNKVRENIPVFDQSEGPDQHNPKKTVFLNLVKRHKLLSAFCSLILFFSLVFVFLGGLSNPSGAIKSLVFAAGKEIAVDDKNHTNILLLGVGGGKHDGADLTDTIMIASLDHDNRVLSFLSIPRDLYFKTELSGKNKINAVYDSVKASTGSSDYALTYLKDEIAKSFGVDIHYYAKVDFAGFTQIIDALGGINVEVENDIYDPYYPKDGTIEYETFYIKKGSQQLDGETALKYVRSRKTTSDFDRSLRQQQVITAIKGKALSLGTLTNPKKIRDLYDSISDNYETNISLREIIYLAKLADKYSDIKVKMHVMHDDPSRAGGFLYTPMRELYNGMFVLLPMGDNFDVIKQYAEIVLYYPGLFEDGVSLQILNGTKTPGQAATVRMHLKRLGFSVPRFGNADTQDKTKTVIYLRNPQVAEETLNYLSAYLGAEIGSETPTIYNEEAYFSSADLILVIGEDFDNARINESE